VLENTLKLATLNKEINESNDAIFKEESNIVKRGFKLAEWLNGNKKYLGEIAQKVGFSPTSKSVVDVLSGFAPESLFGALTKIVLNAFGFDNATPKLVALIKDLKIRTTDIAENEILDRSFWSRLANVVNSTRNSAGNIVYDAVINYLNSAADKMKDSLMRNVVTNMAYDVATNWIVSGGDRERFLESMGQSLYGRVVGAVNEGATKGEVGDQFYDNLYSLVEGFSANKLANYFETPRFKRLYSSLEPDERLWMDQQVEKALRKDLVIDVNDYQRYKNVKEEIAKLDEQTKTTKEAEIMQNAGKLDFGAAPLNETDSSQVPNADQIFRKREILVENNMKEASGASGPMTNSEPATDPNVLKLRNDLLLATPLPTKTPTREEYTIAADGTKHLGDGPGTEEMLIENAADAIGVAAQGLDAEQLDTEDILAVTNAAQSAASEMATSMLGKLLALCATHEQQLVTMRPYPIDSSNWQDWMKERNIEDTPSRFIYDNVTHDLLLEPRSSGYFNCSGGLYRAGGDGGQAIRCRQMLETFKIKLHTMGSGPELVPSQETTDMTTNFNGATVVTSSSALKVANDTWDAMWVAQFLTNSYPWLINSEGRSNALPLFKLLAYTQQLTTVWCDESPLEVQFAAHIPTGGAVHDDRIPVFPLANNRVAADADFKFAVTTWRDVIRHMTMQTMKSSGPGNNKVWNDDWAWHHWGHDVAVVFLDNVERLDWRKVLMRTVTKLEYPFVTVKFPAVVSHFGGGTQTWTPVATNPEVFVPRAGLVEVVGPKERVLFVLLDNDDNTRASVCITKDLIIDQTTNNVYGDQAIGATKLTIRNAFRLLHVHDGWINNWLYEMRHWRKVYGNYSDWSIAHRMLAEISYVYTPMACIRMEDAAGAGPKVSGMCFVNVKVGATDSVTNNAKFPAWVRVAGTAEFTSSAITTTNAKTHSWANMKRETACGFYPMMRLTADNVYELALTDDWQNWYQTTADLGGLVINSDMAASHAMCRENPLTDFLLEKGYYMVREEANLKDYSYIFQFGEVIRDMSLKMASAYDLALASIDIGKAEAELFDLNESNADYLVPGGISGKRNALDWYVGHASKISDMILNSGSQGTFIATDINYNGRFKAGLSSFKSTRLGLPNAYSVKGEEFCVVCPHQRVSLLFINNYWDNPFDFTTPVIDMSNLKNDKRSIRFERNNVTQDRFVNMDIDWSTESQKNWFMASKVQMLTPIIDAVVSPFDTYLFTDKANKMYKNWIPMLHWPGQMNCRIRMREAFGVPMLLDGDRWHLWPAGSLFKRVGNWFGRANYAFATLVSNSDAYKNGGTNRYKVLYGTTGLSTVYDEDNYFMTVGSVRQFRSYEELLKSI